MKLYYVIGCKVTSNQLDGVNKSKLNIRTYGDSTIIVFKEMIYELDQPLEVIVPSSIVEPIGFLMHLCTVGVPDPYVKDYLIIC